MVPEIKFILTENGLTKYTMVKRIDEHLVKSLEDFRVAANEALTKMIQESGDSSDIRMDEIEDEESSSADEADFTQTPKKKKK